MTKNYNTKISLPETGCKGKRNRLLHMVCYKKYKPSFATSQASKNISFGSTNTICGTFPVISHD
jgi:hypothetical protein